MPPSQTTPLHTHGRSKCCLFQHFSCQSSYSYDSGDINHTLHKLTGLHCASDSDWVPDGRNQPSRSLTSTFNGNSFYCAVRHHSHLGFFCGILYGNKFVHNYDFINRHNQMLLSTRIWRCRSENCLSIKKSAATLEVRKTLTLWCRHCLAPLNASV